MSRWLGQMRCLSVISTSSDAHHGKWHTATPRCPLCETSLKIQIRVLLVGLTHVWDKHSRHPRMAPSTKV